MKTLHLAVLAVAAALPLTPAAAQHFPRNAMLLVSDDTLSPASGSVRLFDSTGFPVSLAIGLANPVDATIGPDGRLYVVSSGDDRVRIVAPNAFGGTVEGILGAGSDLTALAFGPQGSLFVASRGDDLIYEFALDGLLLGTLGGGSPLVDPADLAFGADGNLFVASESAGKVHEFSVDGQYVGEIGGVSQTEASGLAFGSDGRLFVSSGADDRVFVFDASGAEIQQIGVASGLDDPAGLTIGPDGSLHVVSLGDDRVYVFDGVGGLERTVLPAGATDINPSIAFVPHCFPLSGKSTVYLDDEKERKAKIYGTVSLQPGSNRIMLDLPEESELADAFGDGFVVFYGYEAFIDHAKDGRKREYFGQCISADSIEGGVGSVAMEVRGQDGSDGFFTIKSAKCMLLRSDDEASTVAKLQAKKVLN